MIIFGYREATLQTKTFEEGFCTNCGQKGTITCTVFSKHAHVMWIPLFPIGKRTVVFCQHCDKEYKQLREAPPNVQSQIMEFRRKQKAPFWQWTGLLLLAGLIVSAIISGFRETKNTKIYLESPEYNDVYCVKYDNAYSLMYIVDIRDDSIFFSDNFYTVKTISNVKKLHRPEYYDLDTLYAHSRDDLKELYYVDSLILTIWRNLPYSKEELITEDEDEDEEDYYYDEDEEEDEDDYDNGDEDEIDDYQ